jgi:hypothetical protein
MQRRSEYLFSPLFIAFIKCASAVGLGVPDLISYTPVSYSLLRLHKRELQSKLPKYDQAVTALKSIPCALN